MGRLVYGATSVDLDDRTLAHVQIVVQQKLRRQESFMFDLRVGSSDGSGLRSFWIAPAIPLIFHPFGRDSPPINRAWLVELMKSASSPDGFKIVPEPSPPEPVDPLGPAAEKRLAGQIGSM